MQTAKNRRERENQTETESVAFTVKLKCTKAIKVQVHKLTAPVLLLSVAF